MASVSMMASFIGNAAVAPQPSTSTRRTLVMAKAAVLKSDVSAANYNVDVKEEKESSGRRAAMFAVAAAGLAAVAGSGMMAVAVDEPKRGTPEAKKKYAPVCVTMPTARVCHKIA